MSGTQADFVTTKRILEGAGIPVAGEMVTTCDAAVVAAEAVGFPVVMKLVSPDVIHKTDAGVVLLDLPDADAVRGGWELIMERARAAGAERIDGMLVQKQAAPGFELLVGSTQDPVFGPLTMVGSGGRFVELHKDVCPGVGLLRPEDVRRMLGKTRAGKVIEGFRGPALDEAAAVDIAVKVARLLYERTEIRELDLNPVILYPEGFCIVDARMILGEPVHHPREGDLSAARLESLENIYSARSVAVLGASRPGTVGGVILKNSTKVERLYPINPKRKTLLGLQCYPSLAACPEVPDVAVFAVRPDLTISGFREFCEMGGKGAVIVSDGFAEMGRHDLEEQLVEISHAHDVVYVGPNGLGVLDNFSGINTLFLPRIRTALPERPGPVGIISQSGGVGIELLEMASADDLPVGKFVSCGNASGVSVPELLVNLAEDDRIQVIAVYMEGITNGLQFMEVARKVAEKKPILVIKGGMAGGAAATMSHTASLAGSFEAFKAACNQAGVYLLEELTEDPKALLNVLSMLTTQRPAKGKRTAVVSVGGGAGILLADQVTSEGLELAEFDPRTQEGLAQLMVRRMRGATEEEKARVAASAAANPVDLFGDANDDRLVGALRLLNEDDNVDLILMALYLQPPLLSEYLPERLAEVVGEMTKPLIMSLRGYSPYVFRSRDYMIAHGAHSYTVPMIKPLTVALDIWLRYGRDFSA